MKWPWISRRRHMEEFVQLGQAYRAEIEAAEAQAREARRKLTEWVETLGRPLEPYQEYYRDTVVVPIEFTNTLVARAAPTELYEMLARDIVRRLIDMRDVNFPGLGPARDLREVGHA